MAVFEAMGSRIEHMGPAGAGAAAKLVNQVTHRNTSVNARPRTNNIIVPRRDGKILCDHRQDGNDEVHRL